MYTIRGMKGKLDRRSERCVMVGYAENHAEDCYRLYNPETQKIIISRDIIWNENIPIETREHQQSNTIPNPMYSSVDVITPTLTLCGNAECISVCCTICIYTY